MYRDCLPVIKAIWFCAMALFFQPSIDDGSCNLQGYYSAKEALQESKKTPNAVADTYAAAPVQSNLAFHHIDE